MDEQSELLAKYKQDSIHLNQLGWTMAVALGDVDEVRDTRIDADIDVMLDRLIDGYRKRIRRAR